MVLNTIYGINTITIPSFVTLYEETVSTWPGSTRVLSAWEVSAEVKSPSSTQLLVNSILRHGGRVSDAVAGEPKYAVVGNWEPSSSLDRNKFNVVI